MDTTRAQQQALDDDLEPTLQVALDALKLTPFYNAFEISADVPKIYMQEFWVTVSRHHSSLRFKLNGKSHTVNIDNFRDMLKIFPKLPGQIFEEPPLEEEILSFIRGLGHTGEIKWKDFQNQKPQKEADSESSPQDEGYSLLKVTVPDDITTKPISSTNRRSCKQTRVPYIPNNRSESKEESLDINQGR
ncbi:hypothetical protein Tco_1282979 [Tanacetum coccineum]